MGLQVVHRIPGRLRISAPALRNQPEPLNRIEDGFRSVEGVINIKTNSITGSVLIIYDTGKPLEHMLLQRLTEVSGLTLEPLMPEDKKAAQMPYIAMAIQEPFERINAGVFQLTNGYMDLRYLAPVLLAAYGTAKLIRQGPIPAIPWYLLYWWSFRSFIILNR